MLIDHKLKSLTQLAEKVSQEKNKGKKTHLWKKIKTKN